ncbi:MAG TPA: glutamate-cysteine ligase family protein [Stackebrandtia sp.]|jgi:glutamate--cysteine ligase|uniref:glutamate-cysteine ligase family protein n=1 Tax=Stackebrandtia sp. TaxID=2023065 RepID=UPI002D42035E|nr:glutamate-cysteine ligase family protein [Stackebrandtia sp.]HZE40969.1 glutamate-cysteine ligase family protein [Stackebrandtia sp.]
MHHPTDNGRMLRSRDEAEHYVARVCFKTGPPRLIGVELEHTVHHAGAADAPVELECLRDSLGPHAPASLNPASPHARLPEGGVVTVEPGGQVEISSAPHSSLTRLHQSVDTDLAALRGLLAASRLSLGYRGLDPRGSPPRLRTARYEAMARAFTRHGPHGTSMMGATAGLQVCLDSGRPDQVAARWHALHDMGPALLALFSTSRRPGSACARMRTWLGMDPTRTAAVTASGDPASAWATYAMRAPVLCVRTKRRPWPTPRGVSFADWIAGALPRPPTTADLDLHLSMLFPPVRPRGYLEVRYLDTQPDGEWFAPVAMIGALLATDATIDAAREICAASRRLWNEAARHGGADSRISRAATDLAALACDHLRDTGLPADTARTVTTITEARVASLTTEDKE